uniref:Uncharacterized protein n=1 Tax=Arundo donax TaxID=35708 RepID=A0A0A9A382_ARUDO
MKDRSNLVQGIAARQKFHQNHTPLSKRDQNRLLDPPPSIQIENFRLALLPPLPFRSLAYIYAANGEAMAKPEVGCLESSHGRTRVRFEPRAARDRPQ